MDSRTNNPLPLEGPVILARIYSQARPKEPRVAEIIGYCLLLYWLPCVGIAIDALVHRDFLYLTFLAFGIVLWQAGFWYIKWRGNRARKREREGAYRREEDVAIVKRLKELTDLQAFGRFIPGKGSKAWLTDNGIYFDDGSHLPWEWFQSFDIDVPEKGTHRIILRYIIPSHQEASFKNWIRPIGVKASLFMIAASSIFLIGGVIGYRVVGLRLDVLANFLFCILPLPAVAILILYSWSGLAKSLGKDKVAVIDEVSVPMETVTELLRARLAMNP